MEECTIKALLTLDTIVIDGVKVIQIPLEDILRGKVCLRVNVTPEASGLRMIAQTPDEPAVIIPHEIRAMYKEKDTEKMVQDVVDYLKIISKCWQYRDLKFQTSILKKAAASKPNLNGLIFTFYGKEGDKYLTTLVEQNMPFIHDCWIESNTSN